MKKEKALNRNTSTYLVAFNPHKNCGIGCQNCQDGNQQLYANK